MSCQHYQAQWSTARTFSPFQRARWNNIAVAVAFSGRSLADRSFRVKVRDVTAVCKPSPPPTMSASQGCEATRAGDHRGLRFEGQACNSAASWHHGCRQVDHGSRHDRMLVQYDARRILDAGNPSARTAVSCMLGTEVDLDHRQQESEVPSANYTDIQE